MKKSMLCAGLLTVLGSADYASAATQPTGTTPSTTQQQNSATDPTSHTVLPLSATQGSNSPGTQQNVDPKPQNPVTADPVPTSVNPSLPDNSVPVKANPAPASQGTPAPVQLNNTVPANQPSSSTTTTPTATPTTTTPTTTTPTTTTTTVPATTQPTTTTSPVTPAAQAMDCNYKIPAATTTVDQSVVLKWAQNAAEQSFEFDYNTIDNQLTTLKACFTDQGWQGFNDALQKSGNLNAIKSEKLMVSSMVDGTANITPVKDNQWKVTIPLQVVYQNDKEKLNQPLSISLMVGRKPSGDLGIMQMIATPRQSTTTTPANGSMTQ